MAGNRQMSLQRMVGEISAMQASLDEARRSALDAIGVRVFSWVQIAYEQKSRRQTDAFGVRWDDITPAAIAGRIMKRKVGEELRRKLPRGAEFAKNRAAIIYRAITDPDFLPKFYRAFQREMVNVAIGIDTGRLRRSLQPGRVYGPGESVMVNNGRSILMGTAVRYAGFFDEKRPIFPTQLPQKYLDELQQIAADVIEKVFRRVMQTGGNQ
jgi:hypothetical protein